MLFGSNESASNSATNPLALSGSNPLAGKKKKDDEKKKQDDRGSDYSYSYDSFDLEVEDNKAALASSRPSSLRAVSPMSRPLSPVTSPVTTPSKALSTAPVVVEKPSLSSSNYIPFTDAVESIASLTANALSTEGEEAKDASKLYDDTATSVGDEFETQDEVHKSLNALLEELQSTKFDISILQSKIEARLVNASEIQGGSRMGGSGAVVAVAAADEDMNSQEQLITPANGNTSTIVSGKVPVSI